VWEAPLVIPYNEWHSHLQLVLEYLSSEPVATRGEISKHTGLKESEIKAIIRELRHKGLVSIYRINCYSLKLKATIKEAPA
jgi:DNA-binding IclR family transcriptional regulator